MQPSPEWFVEVDRRLNQDRSDIDALYEISERIETKVDRLAENMDARFEQVDSRFDGLEGRFDGLSQQVAGQRELLERILERLDRT